MSEFQIIEDYLNNLNGDIVIEAELHPDHRENFETKYREITGQDVPTPGNHYLILQPDADKWGPELRIYFTPEGKMPDEVEALVTDNSRPDSRVDQFSNRINKNDLVWHLFENGFRIG